MDVLLAIPLRIESDDVTAMVGPGAPRFVALMNELLLAHSMRVSIPIADVSLNHDTNKPDGRVDAAIHAGSPDPTNYLDLPTCWQYKGRGFSEMGGIKELEKEFAEPKRGDGTP